MLWSKHEEGLGEFEKVKQTRIKRLIETEIGKKEKFMVKDVEVKNTLIKTKFNNINFGPC